MICRECGTRTLYPICAECANEEELSMLQFLYRVEETIQISRDRKKALFVYIMPLTRTMIFGLLVSVVFIITAIYTPYKLLSSLLIPIGLTIFFIGWVVHPPLKTEAIDDYTDMTIRIEGLKGRRAELIQALKQSSDKWSEHQHKLLSLNVYTTSSEG